MNHRISKILHQWVSFFFLFCFQFYFCLILIVVSFITIYNFCCFIFVLIVFNLIKFEDVCFSEYIYIRERNSISWQLTNQQTPVEREPQKKNSSKPKKNKKKNINWIYSVRKKGKYKKWVRSIGMDVSFFSLSKSNQIIKSLIFSEWVLGVYNANEFPRNRWRPITGRFGLNDSRLWAYITF